MTRQIHIGCSGFSYRHWRGLFYPLSLKQSEWFHYYQRFFDTLEVNVTFYRLPGYELFQRWYEQSPMGFVFSVKGSRFITHIKRLSVQRDSIDKFFERVFPLKEKLSVILWQFPPTFKKDTQRLERFLKDLKGIPVRHAFEFRHDSWLCAEVEELLRYHKSAFCMADWPEFNRLLPVTTDFVYIRRHGRGGSYNSCYTEEELSKDAETIKETIQKGLDVYIYFNNDYNAYAPINAIKLKELLSDFLRHRQSGPKGVE